MRPQVVAVFVLPYLFTVALANPFPATEPEATSLKTLGLGRKGFPVSIPEHANNPSLEKRAKKRTPKKKPTKTKGPLPRPTSSQGKRGLSYNDPTLTQPFSRYHSNAKSKVTWAYNWNSNPYLPDRQTKTNTFNEVLHYTPMLWSNATVLTSKWTSNVADAILHYNVDGLLGFNEPDQCAEGSACMTIDAAVSTWQDYIQPFAVTTPLGSPSITNSKAKGAGFDWLDAFLKHCVGCTVDFIALHWYGNIHQGQEFKDHVAKAYRKYKRPIWVTEFSCLGATPEETQTFLEDLLPWLDAQSYVYRYAFWMDRVDPTGLMQSKTKMNNLGLLYDTK